MRTLLLAGLVVMRVAWASPQLDDDYSLRSVAVAVVNLGSEAVHGEAVETSLRRAISNGSRFEISEDGQKKLRDALKASGATSLGAGESADLSAFWTAIQATASAKVHAVFLAEVRHFEDQYRIRLALANARARSLVAHREVRVRDSKRLENFEEAARVALAEVERAIPFQASILRRDGYRVILDRGAPLFRPGMQISAYSLEAWDANPIFDEIGKLEITRAERSLSFARVVSEKLPKTLTVGNKILVADARKLAEMTTAGDRSPSSLREEVERPARSMGYVGLKLGPSFVGMNQSAADDTVASSGSALYFGGSLDGRGWLQKSLFLEAGFRFASANVSPDLDATPTGASLGSSLFGYHLAAGVHLAAPDVPPALEIKIGYGSRKFSIDAAPEPQGINSASYSGILISGDFELPLAEDYGMGVFAEALAFPSLGESPTTGGNEITSLTAADVGLRGYYRYSRTMDFTGRFTWGSFGAEFAGQGTRVTRLLSASQSVRSFLLGVSYYF